MSSEAAGDHIYDRSFHLALQEPARASAEVMVPLLLDLVQPRSVLDVGCGVGAWLAAFARRGIVDIAGIDGPGLPIADLEVPPEVVSTADLTQPVDLGRRFDLVLSLEVAEHLPESAAPGFVELLASHADVVLFSAAVPHQGGTGHLNEQFPDYWARLFAHHDLVAVDCLRRKVWSDPQVAWWYAQNCLVFANDSACDRWPALGRERDMMGAQQLSLVHPHRYLEWVQWGLAESAARWSSPA